MPTSPNRLTLDEILKLTEGVKEWDLVEKETTKFVVYAPIAVPNTYAGSNGEVVILVSEYNPGIFNIGPLVSIFSNRRFIAAVVGEEIVGEYSDSRVKPIYERAIADVERKRESAVSRARAALR